MGYSDLFNLFNLASPRVTTGDVLPKKEYSTQYTTTNTDASQRTFTFSPQYALQLNSPGATQTTKKEEAISPNTSLPISISPTTSQSQTGEPIDFSIFGGSNITTLLIIGAVGFGAYKLLKGGKK